MLCDDEIDRFEQLFDNNIQTDNEQAYRFAVKTKDRTIRIYRESYELLNQVFKNGSFGVINTNHILAKRKAIIEDILSMLRSRAHIYYTFNEEEFEVLHEIEWAMPELTIGVTNGEKMACLYYNIDEKSSHNYLIGVGKAPNFPKNQKSLLQPFKDYQLCNDDNWWYFRKEFGSDYQIDDIVKEIKELVEYIN